MSRIVAAGLVLILCLGAPGGSASAQEDPSPAPSVSPAPSLAPGVLASPAPAPSTLPAVDAAEDTVDLVEPAWRDITPARGPAGREDHTWTVDGAGRYAWLFGGRDGGREFGDLWRYDLEQDDWKKLTPRGRSPAARFGHSAVWVEGFGLIVFGGQRGDAFFDDLWAYDPLSGRWKKLPRNGQAPRPRYGSCMVLAADGRLWISHGFTSAGRFDDTRAYDLDRMRWASIAPDARRPGERCLHDCFTSSSGELVLYGGQDDGAFALGDLWSMGRDHAWQRRPDPALKARRLYAVSEAGGHAYVFGGAGADDQALDDLWRVDRETLEFERLRVPGPAPAARYASTLITDVQRGRLLLFGGQAGRARADVWELVEGATPSALPSTPVPSPSAIP